MANIQDFLTRFLFADTLMLFAVVFGTVSLAVGSLRYLQGRAEHKRDVDYYIKPIEQRVNALDSALRSSQRDGSIPTIPKEDWAEIRQTAVSSAVSELSAEIQKSIRRAALMEGTHSLREQLFIRMQKQLFSLERRANFSLVLGMIFSIFGLIVLYFTFFNDVVPVATSDVVTALVAYAPRLSLVLIIEAVSFFFLRLYSKAIDEIRYTQNEITNVEMKLLGLDESVINNANTSLKNALERISETERNHVLKNGETTTEIEKARLLNSMLTSGNESYFRSIFSRKGE